MKSFNTRFGIAHVVETTYAKGNGIALQLIAEDASIIATLTTNIRGAELESGEFCVKVWSENELIINDCRNSGLFIDTGKRIKTGFVKAEVWKFNMEGD